MIGFSRIVVVVAWPLDQADLSLEISRNDESRLTVRSWHVQVVSGAQSKDRRVYIEPTKATNFRYMQLVPI